MAPPRSHHVGAATSEIPTRTRTTRSALDAGSLKSSPRRQAFQSPNPRSWTMRLCLDPHRALIAATIGCSPRSREDALYRTGAFDLEPSTARTAPACVFMVARRTTAVAAADRREDDGPSPWRTSWATRRPSRSRDLLAPLLAGEVVKRSPPPPRPEPARGRDEREHVRLRCFDSDAARSRATGRARASSTATGARRAGKHKRRLSAPATRLPCHGRRGLRSSGPLGQDPGPRASRLAHGSAWLVARVARPGPDAVVHQNRAPRRDQVTDDRHARITSFFLAAPRHERRSDRPAPPPIPASGLSPGKTGRRRSRLPIELRSPLHGPPRVVAPQMPRETRTDGSCSLGEGRDPGREVRARTLSRSPRSRASRPSRARVRSRSASSARRSVRRSV